MDDLTHTETADVVRIWENCTWQGRYFQAEKKRYLADLRVRHTPVSRDLQISGNNQAL
jgi:hypothetical protein